MAFALRLRTARAQKFPSAKAFADALGVEHETYRTWERGDREPNISAICKIARTLDISLDYLVLGDFPALKQRRG